MAAKMAAVDFFNLSSAWRHHPYFGTSSLHCGATGNDANTKVMQFGDVTGSRVAECSEYDTSFIISAKHPTGKKVFRCPQCQYITDRKNNLKRHIGTMHRDCGKSLECCDVTFHSKASLREHVIMFHRSGYRCRCCSRNFCRKALLKRHLATHGGQKDFVCSICDYSSSHKASLDRHRRTHYLNPYFASAEDEAEESRIGIIQAALHDHLNFLYVAPWRIHDRGHTAGVSRLHRFALPRRLSVTHPLGGPKHLCVADIDDRLSGKVRKPKRKTETGLTGRKRLYVQPYKCSECLLTFPVQTELESHSENCRNPAPEPQRPLRYSVPAELKNLQSVDGELADGDEQKSPGLGRARAWPDMTSPDIIHAEDGRHCMPRWEPSTESPTPPPIRQSSFPEDFRDVRSLGSDVITEVSWDSTQTLPPKKRYALSGLIYM